MKRVVIPELLDLDAGSPQEVADSLADLRWFNRYFGGWRTTSELLLTVSRDSESIQQLTYLDVAGASGDGAYSAQSALAAEGIELQVTVLDRQASHLAGNGCVSITADALLLPFRDKSFDVVGCSLFLHHLEPTGILCFLSEALRVARQAVVINDLRRTWFHWFAAWAGQPLYRSRLTRHDAPASVRRSFTPAELQDILKEVPAINLRISHHYFFRMGVLIRVAGR